MKKMPKVTKTIQEMCKIFEVTPRTLRFYESKELLFPERQGTRRLFTRRDTARLKLILRGKKFGFSLEEIRQLLNMYDLDDAQTTQLQETYRIGYERLNYMKHQQGELKDAIRDLKSQLKQIQNILKNPTPERSAIYNQRKY
jgi:DNA-binding transcriptional MerR regulator